MIDLGAGSRIVCAPPAAGRDSTEIARPLFVAPSTVKTHVNRIFGMLGVVSRTQAVARAQAML